MSRLVLDWPQILAAFFPARFLDCPAERWWTWGGFDQNVSGRANKSLVVEKGGRAVYFGNAWTPGSLWYISNGVSSRILSFLKKEKI
jgi:hypothetical protein